MSMSMNPRMRIGEGRISGALAIVFGSISFGGVLCFLFPEFLTTPEFRAQYDVEALRRVLAACMFVAFGFALRSLMANQSKQAGLIGGGLTLLALALGGAGVETGEVAGPPVYLSLDYLLLSLIATRMMVYLPLYVLGFDQGVLVSYVAIVATHAVMNHTNTRLPYGPLEHLIVSPRIHHWHHSTEERAHNKNYAVHFPWIDKLFGTYYAPRGEWPEAVGLDDAAFPVGYVRQLLYPFRHDPLTEAPKGEVSTR